MHIDVTQFVEGNTHRLKWKIDLEDLTDSDVEEIKEAVEYALRQVVIWPEYIETLGWGTIRYEIEFSARLESGYGSPSDYGEYLDHLEGQDTRFTNQFGKELLDALQEKGLIGRSEKEEEYWPDPEEKKKQIELPFEAGAEEGAARERDLDYIRSPEGAALRRRVGLRENKKGIKITVRR